MGVRPFHVQTRARISTGTCARTGTLVSPKKELPQKHGHGNTRAPPDTHTHVYADTRIRTRTRVHLLQLVLLQVDASHVTLIEDIARSVCFIHHTRLYASAHARLHECARACQALKLSTLPGLQVGYCGHRPSAPVTPYSVQPLIPMRLPVHLFEAIVAPCTCRSRRSRR